MPISRISGFNFTLANPAVVATAGAKVYYDNAPGLNIMLQPPTANHTFTFPAVSFAVGSEIDLIQSCGTPPCEPNVVIQGQGDYPTCCTTLFSPKGEDSAVINSNEDGTNSSNGITFRNFCMTGNKVNAGE